MTESSRSKCKSRSWITMPLPLFPAIERLLFVAANDRLPLLNVALNVGPQASPAESGTVLEISGVGLRVVHSGDQDFAPTFVAAFHNRVALREVLQPFGHGLPAIEGLGDLVRIDAR